MGCSCVYQRRLCTEQGFWKTGSLFTQYYANVNSIKANDESNVGPSE